MRLIDADTIFNNELLLVRAECYDAVHAVVEKINNAPTIDAIEVIRCKDCKHRDPEDHKCDSGALERAGCVFPVADDYFCAWGERREDDK